MYPPYSDQGRNGKEDAYPPYCDEYDGREDGKDGLCPPYDVRVHQYPKKSGCGWKKEGSYDA